MNDKLSMFKEKVIDRYFEISPDTNSEVLETPITNQNVEKGEVVISKPTIISYGTEIQGNINIQGNLEVYGKVIGDIIVRGKAFIQGAYITGSIRAESIVVEKSFIQGNMVINEFAEFKEESKIIGDIQAENIVFNSECQGDVHACDSLHFMLLSNVTGAVYTKKLIIDEGAIIDGQIKMHK